MNKISLYILLILVYLGVSKSFSHSERGIHYIIDERVYANYFQGSPLSLILVDSFKMGFLIKTYFQRYKVVHGFKHPEEIIIRTSRSFWEKNLSNEGMSLFRRSDRNNVESTIPLPPGSLYVGDASYGQWRYENSGTKVWRFHRAYRHFPQIFGWGEWRPTQIFHDKVKIHMAHDRPYYGDENEFGKNGEITKQAFKTEDENVEKNASPYKNHLKKLFYLPPLVKDEE